MKKIFEMILVFAVAVALIACSSSAPEEAPVTIGVPETTEAQTSVAETQKEETEVPKETVVDNRKKEADASKTVDNRKNQAAFTEEDFEITGEYCYENDFATVYFVGVKNNSEAVVYVTGNAVAKDSSGSMLGADTAEIGVLGPGEESVMYFYLYDTKGVETMEISYDYQRETYYLPVISKLKSGTNLNDRNVTVSVTNTGDVNAQFVEAFALFLDENENVISYDETYITDGDSEIKVGATQSVQLDCYDDYDHIKLFFTGRSDGTATDAAATGLSANLFEVKEVLYEDSSSTSYYIIVKNNSDSNVSVTGNAVAYDGDQNTLGADDIEIEVLGPGEETIAYFYFWDVRGVDHVEYNLSYSEETYYSSVLANLSVEKAENDSRVVLAITNNGECPAQFVEAYILLYDADGNVVGYDSRYFTDDDSEIKPGATITQQIDTFKSFDHSEVYLTGRYHD